MTEDGSSYVLDPEHRVMGFNTYTYRLGAYETAMPLEIASRACYAKLQEARRAYGLYDVKNDRVLRAYRECAWEHAPEDDPPAVVARSPARDR